MSNVEQKITQTINVVKEQAQENILAVESGVSLVADLRCEEKP